jgi:hypothetical protein
MLTPAQEELALKAEKDGTECFVATTRYVCNNDVQLANCQTMFTFIKTRKKELKAEIAKDLDPLINTLHESHKKALAMKKNALDPWEKAEAAIEAIMRPYVAAKLLKEKKEKEQKEREAQEKAKEDQRLAALEAEIDGLSEEAELINTLPAIAPKVKVESTAKQVEGVGIKQPWTWKITNEALIPDEYWVLDKQKISATVREQKEKTNIGGIEVFQDVKFSG